MRTLAIGDIHGCLTAFKTLLALAEVTPEDLLITLGDYVDRGPDSKEVIDLLIKMQETHQLVTLRGNHEIGMMRARSDSYFASSWMNPMWGGGATMSSYDAERFSDVPESHWAFLEATLPFYETVDHIFVHANLDAELPLDQQNDEIIYWERFGEPEPHISGKTMVCGHSSQTSGRPKNVGHAVCIDTYVYDESGWLTCLDVESGNYWQANEKGETRGGQLVDLIEEK